MITVTRNGLSVKVKGHAQSAEYGKDLICASASILFYTLVEALDRLQRDGKCKCEVKALEGDAEIKAISTDPTEVIHVINTIMIGYEILAEDYPENVKILLGVT